jgi:hypothetical protein
LVDTAGVVVSLDSDVAVLSPVGTPGVLDEEVLETSGIISTVSNNELGVVVEHDGAVFVSDDTTLVVVVRITSGIYTNSDGSSLDGSSQGVGGRKNGSHAGGVNLTLGLVIFARASSSISRGVGILRLQLKRLSHGGNPGHKRVASVAAHIDPRAIDELLLRE